MIAPTIVTSGGEEDSEAVCDCGTDDESIHATTCAAYVQPENPVCCCAVPCTEANEWCDICGFDYTACTGTEEALLISHRPPAGTICSTPVKPRY